jgi:UDP-N-acetylglucosamine transferase subunit ALG13
VIFLTVGTERYPFDRLVRALDDAVAPGGPLAGRQVLAQTGSSDYRPKHFSGHPLLAFAEVRSALAACEVPVAHAGVGTVLLALQLGRIPLLCPRRAALGEHVDDHQVEFAERLAGLGQALVALTVDELVEMIAHYPERIAGLPPPGASGERQRLVAALRRLAGLDGAAGAA